MCPNFHCNLTVRFTFNCCSRYSGMILKLIYTLLKTVHICSVSAKELSNLYVTTPLKNFPVVYSSRWVFLHFCKKLAVSQRLQKWKRWALTVAGLRISNVMCVYHQKSIYHISANSFCGNYSFLNLTLYTVTFDNNTYRCGNYSREETIQGRKLGIRFVCSL